jgi:thiaminase/transcriptional activator TenA
MTESRTAPPSSRMLAANQAAWDAMQSHRFVAAIERDGLPVEIFKAYLVYECAFVEAAMLIFGHMLVKAPGLAERRALAGILQGLAVDQIGYFEHSFAALSITDADRSRALPAAVLAFRDGMLAIARDGGYLDGAAVMLAAEWMYATWCARAARAPIVHREIKRWVDLHAEPAFLAQADWLRRQIDTAPGLTETDTSRLSALFGRALALEIAFHDAPFLGNGGGRR